MLVKTSSIDDWGKQIKRGGERKTEREMGTCDSTDLFVNINAKELESLLGKKNTGKQREKGKEAWATFIISSSILGQFENVFKCSEHLLKNASNTWANISDHILLLWFHNFDLNFAHFQVEGNLLPSSQCLFGMHKQLIDALYWVRGGVFRACLLGLAKHPRLPRVADLQGIFDCLCWQKALKLKLIDIDIEQAA